MSKKFVIAQLTVMMLCVSVTDAQESFERLRKHARPFDPIIIEAAVRHDVDPYLLWTVAFLESRFEPQAISFKDGRPCAFGLMQFVPATAERYGLMNPHNSRDAIDAAARYLRDLLRRFDGRSDLVLAAYNAGEGAVEAFRDGRRLLLRNGKVINPNAIRTNGIPPYSETQNYVTRGLLIYQKLAGQRFLSLPTRSPELHTTVRQIQLKDRQIEVSLYASQIKKSEKKESPRLGSLYAN